MKYTEILEELKNVGQAKFNLSSPLQIGMKIWKTMALLPCLMACQLIILTLFINQSTQNLLGIDL